MFEELNDKQKQAVYTTNHKVLVMAGAGTGKTKVLTNRIMKLLEDGINPNTIIAFTFTNKTSKEMKERIKKVSTFENVYTFHAFCYECIKDLYYLLGFNEIPSIIDDSDKVKIIKDILIELGIDSNSSTYLEYISKIKNHSLDNTIKNYKTILKVFELYQKELKKYSYIDFDDMVYLIVENFKTIYENSDYIQNIKYILVDECQDTNPIQYELINKLTYKDSYVFMVGDEDQLIYSFRNSNIAILRDFKDKCDEIIILNENYRCSKNILDAANNLISHNTNRTNKELYSNIESPYPIRIHEFASDLEEAKGVVGLIINLHQKGFNYEDIAVLYRNNNQSYIIEKELYQNIIPYTVFGNKPIYKYKEIKQILSVYRLIDNSNDLIAFINILNLDQQIIDIFKREYKKTLLDLLDFSIAYKNKLISQISKKIKELISIRFNLTKNHLFDKVLELVNIKEDINKSKSKNEIWERIMFFKSLMIESNDYKEFLNNIYLESDDKKTKGVNLLTIHKAKGLEFKVVFIIGCNEGILPMKNADIEEERRLMYVAMTRTREYAFLSSIESITDSYKSRINKSIFIIEIKK